MLWAAAAEPPLPPPPSPPPPPWLNFTINRLNEPETQNNPKPQTVNLEP